MYDTPLLALRSSTTAHGVLAGIAATVVSVVAGSLASSVWLTLLLALPLAVGLSYAADREAWVIRSAVAVATIAACVTVSFIALVAFLMFGTGSLD